MTAPATPAPASKDPAQPDAHQVPTSPDLVSITRAQINQSLRSPLAATSAGSAIGASLGLTPQQIASLTSGTADLLLSQAQYDNLKTSISGLYKTSNSKDASGSLCGSTASPTAAPKTNDGVPSVTTTSSQVTETTAGTQTKTEKVGSGTVTVRTDIKGTFGGSADHLFALSYKGSDSKDAHWLQFIHREIIGTNADGSSHPQTGTITTTGGTYDLTTGGTATANGAPGKKNYNTDTASASDPFYESGGINNRTADSTTMYDLPGAADARVQAAFAAGAKTVVSRAHFDTFLIVSDKVTYHAQIDVTYSFPDAATKPSPVSTMPSAGAATALPSTIAEKFHEQFSTFNYIK